MKNKIYSLIARLTTVAMLTTQVFMFAPAGAENATVFSDTMSRLEAAATSVTHSFAFTVGTDTEWVSTGSETIIITLASFTAGTGTIVCAISGGSSGTCAGVSATSAVTLTCSTGTCEGDVTVTGFEATNPSAGAYSAVLTGTGEVTGDLGISIVDSDQVTVTATVDPTITFDIDTATTDADSSAPYSVSLGTITTSDSRVSGTTDSVNYIWLDLDTNATGGAVVTVRNVNGANGLVSAAVSADDIDTAEGTIANGTENYGICVAAVGQTTGTLAKAGDYATGTCLADGQTPDVEDLTTTAAAIINTSGEPIAGGRAQITVAVAISAVTDAHDDYTDTLTFVATGTF